MQQRRHHGAREALRAAFRHDRHRVDTRHRNGASAEELAEAVGARRRDQPAGIERTDPARGLGKAQEIRLALEGNVKRVTIERPGLLEITVAQRSNFHGAVG